MELAKIDIANGLIAEKTNLDNLLQKLKKSNLVGVYGNSQILAVRKNVEDDWYCTTDALSKHTHIKELVVNATKWYYEYVIKQIEAEIAEIDRQILSL